ncbi:MAG: lipid A export permease/ATP-binding protein MsbA [Pigmentiphaga sp.]
MNTEPVKQELWKRIYSRVLPYWPAMLVGVLCLVGVAVVQPLMAMLMKPLLDGGFNGDHPEYVWQIPSAIILIFIVRGALTFSNQYLMSYVSNKVLLQMRSEMFDRMLRLPDREFKQAGSSMLLNRFVVDANSVMALATEVVTVLLRETLIVLSLVGVLFYLSWQLTLISLIAFPLSVLIMRIISRRVRRINRETLTMNGELTKVVSEGIEGQRVVKLFGGYEQENRRFAFISAKLRRFAMRNTVASAAAAPITQTIAAVALSIVVAVALSQAAEGGQITVGGFAAFVTAMIQMLDPLKRLANIAGPMQRMMVAAESVYRLLDAEEEVDHGTRTLPEPVKGRLVFDQVSHQFSDAERPTLDNIELVIEPGQTVAFIGRSGSGKTTLLSMVPRFVDPTGGRLLIDDIPVQDLSLASLRQSISLVSQDVVLFDDTIAANVSYGSKTPPSETAIREALANADLLSFVEAMPEGIHTKVGQNAARLSGGQRQRLAIARALMKNAPILILDEATSALDNESERQVQASLERLMKGRTTLVIAHRLSTIQDADLIVVLDAGRIQEMGSHEQLLEANGLYASLWQMQFHED